MNLQKYQFRIEHLDSLIRLKATGPPKELAERLKISESHLYRILESMKELGAPIAYSRIKRSYFYKFQGKFAIGFQLSQSAMGEIYGGSLSRLRFQKRTCNKFLS